MSFWELIVGYRNGGQYGPLQLRSPPLAQTSSYSTGGLELCLGELNPPKLLVATGLVKRLLNLLMTIVTTSVVAVFSRTSGFRLHLCFLH